MASAVASFVVMFMSMVAITLLLRRRGVLGEGAKPIVSTILLDIIAPALIFGSVSGAHPSTQHIEAAGVVFSSEIITAIIAFAIGRYLIRLDRALLGVFIIASTFSSTGLIGNALIQILFKGNQDLISTSVIISQFGVGIPANTLGIFLAIRFGSSDTQTPMLQHLKKTLTVPCMYALYAGLLWSFLDLPKTGYGLEALFGTCTLVAAALPFVSAMVVGLSLEKFRFRDDSYVLLSAVIISLLIQPALVIGFTNILNLEQNTRVIAQLFSAMPATPLAAVFAVKFGGDASLASKIVTTTLLISAITLPLVALIG